ncbi:MAG: hemolysin III family protein [Syntrophales bacterium]|nr:hemolysin III family protein [Syntrophales bacterium]
MIRSEEKISFYSHLVGVFAAIAGTVYLIYVARTSVAHVVVSTVYGFSAILLFSASSLYHALKQNEDEISIWRKLDHSAIFFMIAGTYTPVCYVYLSGSWKWSIIMIQWVLVAAGMFLKFFYLHGTRYFSTIIYILMGWIGIVAIKEFLTTMPPIAIFYLFAGGISYTVGAIFYAMKKPTVELGFGFHEIFHLFVLLGGVFHYLLVYIALRG